MVGYIAEKNDGSFERTSFNLFWFIPINIKYTVTIGDTTITYTTRDVREVNGVYVIDHEILMRDFGLTEIQATHQAGDRFNTEEHAVMAFGFMYSQKSITERQEYGAVIDRHDDGRFSFENVRNSTVSAAEQGHTIDPKSGNSDPWRNQISYRYNSNSVATVHTHWRPNGNLNFSPPAGTSNGDYNPTRPVAHMYLVNRNGEIYYSERSTARGNINGWSQGIMIIKLKKAGFGCS